MYKLILCLRYLKTRYIGLASIISVMLGVATMIVVNSVYAGFSTKIRDRIQGLLADVSVESNQLRGMPNAEKQMELIRKRAGNQIQAMTPIVKAYGMLTFRYRDQWITRPATLIGIDPKSKSQVSPLTECLQSYQRLTESKAMTGPAERSLDKPPSWDLTPEAMAYRRRRKAAGQRQSASAPGLEGKSLPAHRKSPEESSAPNLGRLYVGVALVSYVPEEERAGPVNRVLMVRPGDDVIVSTVTVGQFPVPVHFPCTVVDIFQSGMPEYDSNLVLCNIECLQKVRRMVDPNSGNRWISGLEIKLKDGADAEQVLQELRAAFPSKDYAVTTWEQKQAVLLAALEIETAVLNLLLFLIICVAGFGIMAIFFMIVVEKTRDIGILKSLGASSRGIMTVFLSYGLGLGIVGSGAGLILGLLFVRYINAIESFLSWVTGRKVFDERVYYFSEIPTRVEPLTVILVVLGAIAVAVLASAAPAVRASRLHPADALRYQ